jgi:hypothetical protein
MINFKFQPFALWLEVTGIPLTLKTRTICCPEKSDYSNPVHTNFQMVAVLAFFEIFL